MRAKELKAMVAHLDLGLVGNGIVSGMALRISARKRGDRNRWSSSNHHGHGVLPCHSSMKMPEWPKIDKRDKRTLQLGLDPEFAVVRAGKLIEVPWSCYLRCQSAMA